MRRHVMDDMWPCFVRFLHFASAGFDVLLLSFFTVVHSFTPRWWSGRATRYLWHLHFFHEELIPSKISLPSSSSSSFPFDGPGRPSPSSAGDTSRRNIRSGSNFADHPMADGEERATTLKNRANGTPRFNLVNKKRGFKKKKLKARKEKNKAAEALRIHKKTIKRIEKNLLRESLTCQKKNNGQRMSNNPLSKGTLNNRINQQRIHKKRQKRYRILSRHFFFYCSPMFNSMLALLNRSVSIFFG